MYYCKLLGFETSLIKYYDPTISVNQSGLILINTLVVSAEEF